MHSRTFHTVQMAFDAFFFLNLLKLSCSVDLKRKKQNIVYYIPLLGDSRLIKTNLFLLPQKITSNTSLTIG